jgi:hypothetical protein
MLPQWFMLSRSILRDSRAGLLSGQWLDRDARAGDRAALLTIRSRALYAAAQLALNLVQHAWATAFAREELALGQRCGQRLVQGAQWCLRPENAHYRT